MRASVNSLGFVVAFFAASSAWAEQVPGLVVERGPGAEQCPDGESLGARIEQIRGRSAHEFTNSYHVVFSRKDDVFTAVIRTGPTGAGVRTLENGAPSCASLASATAVTLALLFDSDIASKPPPEKPAEPPPPIPVFVAPPPEKPAERPKPMGDATLSVGAVGLVGVVRPIVPAVTGEIGIAGARWRVSLGALVALPQTIPLGVGTVHEQLWSGLARVCGSPWRNDAIRLDLCSGATVGLVTANAEGYSINDRQSRPWVAVPFEAAIASWKAPIGWEFAAGGLVPLHRPDFAIDNVGVAYQSPKVGATLAFRAIGILPW